MELKRAREETVLQHHLNTINHRSGVLVVVGAVISLATIDFLLKITLTSVPLVPFTIAVTLACVCWFQLVFKPATSKARQVVGYLVLNGVAFYALAFLFPLPSAYFFFVMILPMLIYFDLGIKASYICMAIWGLAMTARFAQVGMLETKGYILFLIYYATTIAFLDYMLNFLKIADDERKALEVVTEQSELERSRLQTLVNNLNDAVIACDQNFTVLLSNPRATGLLDTHRPLVGRKLDELLDLKDAKGKLVTLSELVAKDAEKSIHVYTNYKLWYSETDSINMYIAISRIQRGEGSGGYVVLLRDITKMKSLEDERNEFISIMSHELRTPVSIVEGGISLAQAYTKNGMDDKVAEYLEKAHVQALMLAEIVNSLSTLVHSERDGQQLAMKEVDPKGVIDHLKTAYQPQIEAKGLELIIRQAAGLPLLYTSEEYLFEVLQNLVTNAIKYTKKGTITMAVEPVSAGKQVSFSISDSGIGISKSDLDHIFEKFWRSEDFHTRESGGTGLGLYITKKLVTNLGANIKVKSTLGKGTTFTVTLPVHPSINSSEA